MIELYFCLVLAHLTADFVLQTERTCEDKKERHWIVMANFNGCQFLVGSFDY